MNPWQLLCYVVALVLAGLAALGVAPQPSRVNLPAAALFFFILAALIPLVTH